MNSNIETSLRPLWDAILAVYQEYARLCERHKLRHYLAFGSVLGAVRHKGFIPWDDDLDVVMPRQDYDVFWEIAEKELPSFFRPVTVGNTREYMHDFGKIMETRIDVIEDVAARSKYALPQGIFIDVFPVDGCFTSPFCRFGRRLASYAQISRKKALLDSTDTSFRGMLVRQVGHLLRPFFPDLKTARDFLLYNDKRLSYPLFGSTKICALGNEEFFTGRIGSRRMPCSWYGDPAIMEFEGLKVPVPSHWHEYLTTYYGDYMILPPVEKRCVPTHGDEPEAPWKYGPTGV